MFVTTRGQATTHTDTHLIVWDRGTYIGRFGSLASVGLEAHLQQLGDLGVPLLADWLELCIVNFLPQVLGVLSRREWVIARDQLVENNATRPDIDGLGTVGLEISEGWVLVEWRSTLELFFGLGCALK